MFIELTILIIFAIVLAIISKVPPFKELFINSSIYQRLFYFILFFAALFPIVERYYSVPVRLGIVKAVMLTLLLFTYCIRIIKHREYTEYSDIKLFVIVYLLFVISFLCVLTKDVVIGGIQINMIPEIFMSYVYYPLVALFTYKEFKNVKIVKNFMRLVLYLAIIMGIIGLLQYILGPVFLESTGMAVIKEGAPVPSYNYATSVNEIKIFRVFSTLNDQQAYAAFLMLSLISILYFYIVDTKNKYIGFLVLSGFTLFSLLTTLSLTVILAVFLIPCCYVVLKFILEKKIDKKIVLLILFLGITLSVGLLNSKMRSTILSRLSYKKGTVAARRDYFSTGVNAFVKQPMGYGLSKSAMNSTGSSADCYWLWALLQMGIITFIFYISIYAYPILKLLFLSCRYGQTLPSNRSVMAYLILSLLMVNLFYLNLSNNPMKTGPANLVFWAIVGIALNKDLWIGTNNAQ